MAVGQQSPGAEGKGPAGVVQGKRLSHLRVLLKHGRLLAFLVLAGNLSVAGLNAFFLHGERPVDLRKDKKRFSSGNQTCYMTLFKGMP